MVQRYKLFTSYHNWLYTSIYLPDFDNIYLQAQSLSQIKSAEYQVLSSQIGCDIVKSLLYPEINLRIATNTNISDIAFLYDTDKIIETSGTPSYNTKKFPYQKQFKHNIVPSITIGLTYPIFNKFAYNINKDKVKIIAAESDYILQERRNALYFEIKKVYSDLSSSISKYASSIKYLETIQNSFVNSGIKLVSGKITTYDYNLAKNNLIKAEKELLKNKYEILFKMNILYYYQQKDFVL